MAFASGDGGRRGIGIVKSERTEKKEEAELEVPLLLAKVGGEEGAGRSPPAALSPAERAPCCCASRLVARATADDGEWRW